MAVAIWVVEWLLGCSVGEGEGGVVGQYNKAQTFIHDTRYRKSIP